MTTFVKFKEQDKPTDILINVDSITSVQFYRKHLTEIYLNDRRCVIVSAKLEFIEGILKQV